MIVCSCNTLSDTQIRTTMEEISPRTPGQVYRCLGCTPRCGVCAVTIRAILRGTGVGATAACPSRDRCPIARARANDDACMHSEAEERRELAATAAAP
ncbi:MAG TPA: (2Fe-2S)-binding protein [Planctomycetes bacterium]|nr:(2Fe-2S)-binding protein [Planctomycetota bacterium]